MIKTLSFDLGLISDGPNECTLPVLSCVAQQPCETDSSEILIPAVTLESKDCTWNHAIDSLHCLQLLNKTLKSIRPVPMAQT